MDFIFKMKTFGWRGEPSCLFFSLLAALILLYVDDWLTRRATVFKALFLAEPAAVSNVQLLPRVRPDLALPASYSTPELRCSGPISAFLCWLNVTSEQ